MWADYKSARAGVAIGLVYRALQMLILNAGRLQIRPGGYTQKDGLMKFPTVYIFKCTCIIDATITNTIIIPFFILFVLFDH